MIWDISVSGAIFIVLVSGSPDSSDNYDNSFENISVNQQSYIHSSSS